jgi:anaerobic selenocysteine-containing dehydrogenase
LEENRSIKTVSETFLSHFIVNVNYLAWPDPLIKLHPHPIAEINPDTARQQGIGEGDWVVIFTILRHKMQSVC